MHMREQVRRTRREGCETDAQQTHEQRVEQRDDLQKGVREC